ncbi:MAG: adenylosuccinate lyase [Anaerolineae bacterium]|jgi:adenylosuccinate lyase|nr:adenylosuccinate lyase [Anaerolineae bacterium]
MKNHKLTFLSPIDGRYAKITKALRTHFSEFAYIRNRAQVEIDYLKALSQNLKIIRPLSKEELDFLNTLKEDFSLEDAERIKEIEQETRHDVKAIEYFLKERLNTTSMADLGEWLHFGLTSADVNFTAYALSLRNARDFVLLPAVNNLLTQIADLVEKTKSTPILARTHGQPAVPSTFGKEIAVFLSRLIKQRDTLSTHIFEAKFSGAVGSYNAQSAAFPEVNWQKFNLDFFKRLDLQANTVTTQILPYDNWLVFFQALHLTNSILLDFSQDMWRYISNDYLKLRAVEGEIGSSTMPQKVNPIDFENAEGNLGIANTLLEQFIRKLPVSRLQRDLSDSTVRRNFGAALGYCLIAYSSISRGLNRVEANQAKIKSDLENHWEVVAEGAQTILRAAKIPKSYEKLKTLTRGKEFSEKTYLEWIDDLDVDENLKAKLRELSPQSYIGLSEEIAQDVLDSL